MIDALISAGASLLGGLFNRNAEADRNAQNIALQREFAQNGISWRVADAQRAGIHPLAALGANTTSFSPQSIGSNSFDFGSIGQDLGRAAKAMANENSREAVDEREARKLQLEKGRLENDILRQELNSKVMRTSRMSGQVGPPLPPDSGVPPGALAHLSRKPTYAETGNREVITDKKLEQADTSTPSVRTLPLFGFDWKTSPRRASAEAIENEYGDDGLATVLSNLNILEDARYNIAESQAWKNWSDFVNRRFYEIPDPFGGRYRSSPYRKQKYTARYMGGPRTRAWGE